MNRGGLSLICCAAGLLVLGFPNALTFGVMAGVLEFVPLAGWMLWMVQAMVSMSCRNFISIVTMPQTFVST